MSDVNDETKAAVEVFRRAAKRLSDRDPFKPMAVVLLAHIDTFDARLAAAREEQREACAQAADDFMPRYETDDGVADAVRAISLTSTPLADRIAEFERLQQVWLMSPEAAKRLASYRELAEKCAALRAQVAEMEEHRAGQRAWQAQSDAAGVAMLEECSLRFFESEERAEKATAERDTLRAQVEAARAECATYRCKRCHESSCILAECHAARGIERAMDEAKP